MVNSEHKYKKVVLFNGPPHSGKDTAVTMAHNFIKDKYGIGEVVPWRPKHMKFADPLKMAAHALYGIPYSCEHYERENGNKWKDEAQVEFFGKTPRSEYIELSELHAKRRHGDEVFGQVAARRVALEKSSNVFLFSDSGFAREALPIISLIGKHNVYVVELSREGCSFEGDSRSYVGSELSRLCGGDLTVLRIPNYGDKSDLRLLVQGTMSKFFKVPME